MRKTFLGGRVAAVGAKEQPDDTLDWLSWKAGLLCKVGMTERGKTGKLLKLSFPVAWNAQNGRTGRLLASRF